MTGDFDISNKIFSTDRLYIRPWKISDLRDLNEYAKYEEVGLPSGWMPHKSLDDTRIVLKHFLTEAKNSELAIVLKENNKVIGSICAKAVDDEELGEDFTNLVGREIGYCISKDYWGHEYCKEAVNELIKYCFDELNYDFLTCGYFADNVKSARINEKCGFKFLKDSEHQDAYGQVKPIKLNILYKKNWRK